MAASGGAHRLALGPGLGLGSGLRDLNGEMVVLPNRSGGGWLFSLRFKGADGFRLQV